MNNQIPYLIPPQYMNNNTQELNLILQELRSINDNLKKLISVKNNKYLEKDDSLYML